MSHRTGFLTVRSADNHEIYGEFPGADWENKTTDVGEEHVFTGIAGDGTFATFERLNVEGISHVRYAFEIGGQEYEGRGQVLAPRKESGKAVITVESIEGIF